MASVRATRPASNSASQAPRTQRKRSEAPAADDLSAIVAGRIRSIDSSDPQRGRKAMRMFLEIVVLSELGPHLANDPKFNVMLDHIEHEMNNDADLAQASHEAAEFLLRAADGPAR